MNGLLANAVLIYTLLSCGALLIAFFNYRAQPRRYVVVGFWAICAHIVYKLMWLALIDGQQYEMPIPLGLIYPVLLYLFAHAHYRSAEVASPMRLALLFLPFSLHVVLFAVASMQPAASGWAMGYSTCYYGACLLSLLTYAILIVRLYSRADGPSTATDILIRQLTVLCFGLVVLTYVMLYEILVGTSSIGFEARPMVYFFLAIGFALVLKYWWTEGAGKAVDDEKLAAASGEQKQADLPTPKLPRALEQHIIDVVERELIQSKLFLNPDVSLDMLSQHTAIPRHQLTQVFNRHYQKAFYQFIAAARIEYSLVRISEMGDTMTLDSLSYECGFNSKTSFNRYFKAYTGMTPSEYRAFCGQMLCVLQ